MKQNKKEELQSRREFFKRAAKGALPILGAIALANMPMLASAGETNMGCTAGCRGGCSMSCSGSCQTTCKGSCHNGCNATCSGTCKGSCGHSSR